MESSIAVRRYEWRDRARVRHICHVTGYMGEPVDWMWRDVESFADLFTSYYTDAEPQSAWVAELDGAVAGYLLGFVDSRRAWNPAKIFGRHFVRRGIGFRPGTAGVVWRSFGDVVVDALRRRLPPVSLSDAAWPAHLHIDLLPHIRGGGVGATLLRRWIDELETTGVSGCYLETLGENHGAIAFFESMGFSPPKQTNLRTGAPIACRWPPHRPAHGADLRALNSRRCGERRAASGERRAASGERRIDKLWVY